MGKNGNNNKNANNNRRVSELTMCGLFAAIAMIFSYLESLIPIPWPVPGMKLGIANIAIIAVLYMYGTKDAFFVNLIRIVLISILFGNFNSFMFSICGGMASLFVMALIKKTGKFPIIGVSVVGGVIHNVTQLIVAVFILGSPAVIYLIPVFIILGVVTGIMCGIVASIFLKKIENRL